MIRDTQAIHVIYMNETDAGEMCTLSMIDEKDRVDLIERTSGPDTEFIYGDSLHTQKLTLGKDAVTALKRALGSANLIEGLRKRFAEGCVEWLSDISDILDGISVPYVYAAYGSAGVVFRPPFDFV